MTDQIQKLGEELYHKYWDDIGEYTAPWSDVCIQYKDRWCRIAKNLLERELEARLEEVKLYGDLEREQDLTNQLQQLRGGNENS